ncbi:MAG: response regulator transcription factor [Thermoanaerobaculia bacterium]|nr:response regulator transcription factor [Thermoanaerobaculia bacterium]
MARKTNAIRVKRGESVVRLVVTDGYPIMVDGLKALFAQEDGVEVVAVARSISELLRILPRLDPDVLLLDSDIPGDGVDPLQAIHDLGWDGKIVLHAGNLDHHKALEALQLGVPGVILKTMEPELLVQCVRRISDGHQWLEKDSLAKVLEVILQKQDQKQRVESRLTPRESEIVRLAVTGLANKKIANRLSISTSTVKTHLHNIYEKLEVNGRWELSQFAREREI